MDVSGRTKYDPAAEALVGNILRSVDNWKPADRRKAIDVGEDAGKIDLKIDAYQGGELANDQVLVVGPGGGKRLNGQTVERFLKNGGHLLAIGLDQREANAFLPFQITTRNAEHIAARFEPFALGS